MPALADRQLPLPLRSAGWSGIKDKSPGEPVKGLKRLHPLHPLIRTTSGPLSIHERSTLNKIHSIKRTSLSILSRDAQPGAPFKPKETSDDAQQHDEDGDYVFMNHDLYRKICSWFESWRVWQKKICLTGITARCSTDQLESLATTLEPLFHRDFVASLRERYPSASFRRKKAQEDVSSSQQSLLSHRSSRLGLYSDMYDRTNLSRIAEHYVGHLRTDYEENAQISDNDLAMIVQLAQFMSTDIINVVVAVDPREHENGDRGGTEGDGRGEGGEPAGVGVFASGLAGDILGDVMEVMSSRAASGNVAAVTDAALLPSATREQSAQGGEVEGVDMQVDALGNLLKTSPVDESAKDGEVKDTETREAEGDGDEEEQGLTVEDIDRQRDVPVLAGHSTPSIQSHTTMRSSLRAAAGKKKQKRPEDYRWEPKSFLPPLLSWGPERTNLFSKGGVGVEPQRRSAVKSSHSHRSHLTSSTHADKLSVDYFDKERLPKLGPMQSAIRYRAQARLTPDTDIPVQQKYKHSKWWSSMDTPGRHLAKPKHAKLHKHFHKQIADIWQMMTSWDSHETTELLVNIIKLCDQTLLGYLANSIVLRLQERLNIGWLTDDLMIKVFTYLDPKDLKICNQVSRRWKYLASSDKLWKKKLKLFGKAEGIPGILSMVRDTHEKGEVIDWRVAYLEMYDITTTAKQSLPIPLTLRDEDTRTKIESPVPLKRIFLYDSASSATGPTSVLRIPTIVKPDDQSQASRVSSLQGVTQIFSTDGRRRVADSQAMKGRSRSIQSLSSSQLGGQSVLLGQSASQLGHSSSQLIQSKERLADVPEERTSAHSSVTRTPTIAAQTKPLRTWKQNKKKSGESQDVALDVRPPLVQQRDILQPPTAEVDGLSRQLEGKLEEDTAKVVAIARVKKLSGHMDSVLCCECDSRRLITGSMDRTIRVWDIRSGRSLHKMYGHRGGINCMQFDNDRLYSGSWDRSIMIWDLLNFERVQVLTGHTGSVSCMKMNYKYLVSGSHDGTVRIWSRITTQCEKVITGHCDITSLELIGSLIITASTDKCIRLVDGVNEQYIGILDLHTDPVVCIKVWGSLLLAGTTTGSLYFWDLQTQTLQSAITAHYTTINAIAVKHGRIYTTANDSSIKEWDVKTLSCVRSLQGHKGPVNDLKTSKHCLISCGTDGIVRMWDSRDVSKPAATADGATSDKMSARSDLGTDAEEGDGQSDRDGEGDFITVQVVDRRTKHQNQLKLTNRSPVK